MQRKKPFGKRLLSRSWEFRRKMSKSVFLILGPELCIYILVACLLLLSFHRREWDSCFVAHTCRRRWYTTWARDTSEAASPTHPKTKWAFTGTQDGRPSRLRLDQLLFSHTHEHWPPSYVGAPPPPQRNVRQSPEHISLRIYLSIDPAPSLSSKSGGVATK